jgi:hypothetical protein
MALRLPGVLLASFALAAAFGQNTPPPVSLQGIVIDKASRTPIAGARVSVFGLGANGPNTPAVLPAFTDGGGSFAMSLPAGSVLTLLVSLTGYEPYQQRQLTTGDKNVFLEIALDRLAEIRGRLIDDESRKPAAGVHVTAVRADGLQMAALMKGAITPNDGGFDFKDVNRGDYYLRIEGTPGPLFQSIPAKDLAGEGREKALQVPEPAEGYGIVAWPEEGGSALHTASDVMDVGDIRLRRRKLHNLSGVLGGCEEGGSLQVLLLRKNGGTDRLADLDSACGNGFRILNLPDGAFTLIAQGGPPRRFVSQSIDGLTRSPVAVNVSTAVTVRMFLEVEGVLRGDLPQDLQDVRIALTAETAVLKIDSPARLAPDEREALLFGNERYRMLVTPPPSYYLKQVFYNGVEQEDAAHFTAVAAASSTLRLVLAKNPAAVEVQGPPGAMVFLVPDGLKFVDFDIARATTPVGAEGRARFAGLGPGKYRAFVAAGVLPTTQERLEEAMRGAQEVTVAAGQTVSVTLALP